MGRCSLTVALPTISAAGIEAVGIPTAVLSNHTAYESWTFHDLSDELLPIVGKWEGYDHHFDMIYTGYLSNNQVPIIIEIIRKLKEKGTSVFVDPAMADFGKLYPGFDGQHVQAMRELFAYADYVKPNLTEACLLTDTPYPEEGDINEALFLDLAKKLSSFGPRYVIISGAKFEKGMTGVFCYDAKKGSVDYFQDRLRPGKYHGTGDLFSSALVSCLVRGISLRESTQIAHGFVAKSIELTLEAHGDGVTYGPEFEEAIPGFIKRLGL